MAAEEPRLFSGTSAKGKKYEFAQQRVQIFTGKKTVECTIRRDSINEFGELPIGTKASFKVLSARIVDGQVGFDIEV